MGKTVTGSTLASDVAYTGRDVAWIVPTFKNARPCWREFEKSLAPIWQYLDTSRSELRIGFPSKGSIQFFTDENADAMRGSAFHLVIGDEASRLREETYEDIILATLADHRGVFCGFTTPRGKNWWWRLCQRGLDKLTTDTAYFHAPTSINPLPNIQHAFHAAMERYGANSRTFRQEWMAEFIDNAGSVFGDVRSCATLGHHIPHPDPADTLIAGLDWGRTIDSTVCSLYSTKRKGIVGFDRFTGFEEQTMLARVVGYLKRLNCRNIVVEVNIAGWVAEALQRANFNVVKFTTTNATKGEIVDLMTSRIAERSIGFVTDETLIAEFEAFDYERLPSGLLRYSAPSGFHDDIVIASCLATWGADTNAPIPSHAFQHYAEGFAV